PKIVFIALLIPFWLVFLVVLILHIFLCLIYYGIPLVFLVKTVLFNYSTLALDFSAERFKKRIVVRYCLSGCLIICIIFAFLYILGCATVIFGSSTTFITSVLAFTFIGAIAHPTESFSYVILIVAIIGYISKVVNHFNNVYADLLEKTIKISEDLESIRNNAENPSPINRSSLDDYTVMDNAITTIATHDVASKFPLKYVHYNNDGIPGVEKPLFSKIVEI
ncbi:unnamed protein product, partial [Owenia fusiformis]